MKQIKDMTDDELLEAYETQLRRQGGDIDKVVVGGHDLEKLENEIERRGLIIPIYKQ
jgi:hypothetical protein